MLQSLPRCRSRGDGKGRHQQAEGLVTNRNQGMNYAPLLKQISSNGQESLALLNGVKLLLCMGDPALLSLLATRALQTAHVMGAVTSAREAMALLKHDQPQLVMLSDRLAEGDGIQLMGEIKRRWPHIRVVLLIAMEHRHLAIREAVATGCDGLVLQSRLGTGSMLAALQTVSRGAVYIDRPLRSGFRQEAGGEGPLQPITERERQVLQAAAAGSSNPQIGRALFLAPDTVKTHLSNLLRKLPARDRTHAVVLGLRWGLIDWPDEASSS